MMNSGPASLLTYKQLCPGGGGWGVGRGGGRAGSPSILPVPINGCRDFSIPDNKCIPVIGTGVTMHNRFAFY